MRTSYNVKLLIALDRLSGGSIPGKAGINKGTPSAKDLVGLFRYEPTCAICYLSPVLTPLESPIYTKSI